MLTRRIGKTHNKSKKSQKSSSNKSNDSKKSSSQKSSDSKKSSSQKSSNSTSEYEFITPIVSRVFGEQYASTKIETYENKFNVSLQKKRCVEFSVHKINEILEIHIDYLDNCKPTDTSTLGSGSHTMGLLIDFAREIRKIEGYENTELMVKIDASGLHIHKIKFPLDALFILTRGESWYNSLGFREKTYSDNLVKANTYNNLPMEQLPKKFNKNDNIKDNITCDNTIKDCFVSIFTRIKVLSKKQTLDPVETQELKYYKELLTKEEKKLITLFENTKSIDLYYIF
jgi:hypothetical protein